MSTSIFENCTFHSDLEIIFEFCTETTNQCHLLKEVQLLALILKWSIYYFCTFVFILAGILNIYTISIVFPLFLRMTKRSQKRYIFVISRLISSILAVFALVIIRCIVFVYLQPERTNFIFITIMSILNGFSFYSLMGSYNGMALLIYLGVRHPWYYEHDVTLRHIIYIAIGNYIISMGISVLIGLILLATYTRSPIKCDSTDCAAIVAWINVIFTCLSFGLTMSILSYVLGLLFYNEYKTRRVMGSSGLANAKSKVGWTLFAITLIGVGEGLPNIILLGEHDAKNLSTCESFYQADQLMIPTILSCLSTLIWAFILLIDPIMSVISDKLVKREIRSHVKWAFHFYAKCLEWVFHGCNCSEPHNYLVETLSERRIKF